MYVYANGISVSDEEADEIRQTKQIVIIGYRFRTLASCPTESEHWLLGVI